MERFGASEMGESNRTERKDYSDLAQGMIDDLATGEVPHVGTLHYLYEAPDGRAHAEVVMERIAENPELAAQFDAALLADMQANPDLYNAG